MYERIFYLILVYAVVFILFCFCKNIWAAIKSNPRSTKKTQEYIKHKVEIENKHCNHLPLFDPDGRAYCYGNSWNDKTGKFSSDFSEEMTQLSEDYNIPTANSKDEV